MIAAAGSPTRAGAVRPGSPCDALLGFANAHGSPADFGRAGYPVGHCDPSPIPPVRLPS
jgi:hypothetical protein